MTDERPTLDDSTEGFVEVRYPLEEQLYKDVIDLLSPDMRERRPRSTELHEAIKTLLTQISLRAHISRDAHVSLYEHGAEMAKSCKHSVLLVRLKRELRAPYELRKRVFITAEPYLSEHLDSCHPAQADLALENGMAVYSRLLAKPGDRAEATEWIKSYAKSWRDWQEERNKRIAKLLGYVPQPTKVHTRNTDLHRDHHAIELGHFFATVIEVSAYLGTMGLAGVVGNRADAVSVAAVKHAFQSVRERWSKRTSSGNATLSADAGLTKDEAIDAATAAAIALEYDPSSIGGLFRPSGRSAGQLPLR